MENILCQKAWVQAMHPPLNCLTLSKLFYQLLLSFFISKLEKMVILISHSYYED